MFLGIIEVNGCCERGCFFFLWFSYWYIFCVLVFSYVYYSNFICSRIYININYESIKCVGKKILVKKGDE